MFSPTETILNEATILPSDLLTAWKRMDLRLKAYLFKLEVPTMPIGGSISEYIPIGGSNNADVQTSSPNPVGSGSAQFAKKRYFCKPILFRASLELQRWSRRNLDLNSREIMAKPVFGRLKRNLYSKFDNAYVLTYLTLSRRTTSHVSVHSIAFVL